MLLWLSGSVISFGITAVLPKNREFSLYLSSPPIDAPISPRQGRARHVVVVGGGVGGMTCAARIASDRSAGFTTKVTLLEKNSRIGGRCGSFWVDPDRPRDAAGTEGERLFRHEQGPSLLLLPSVYEEVFTDTGTKTARDYGLEIVPCAPAYQVIFDDGERISVGFPAGDASTREEEALSRAKMDAYEADGARKWEDYLAITAAYLDAGLPNFIEEKLDLLSLPKFLYHSLKDFGKAWPLKPHSDVLDAVFTSHKLRALASFQDLYVGLEPYRNAALLGGGVLRSTAPAVFGLLAALELHPTNEKAGVFAPVGGFQAVTVALEALLDDLDVEIRCDTTVLGVTNEGVWATATNEEEKDSVEAFSELGDDGDAGGDFIPADLVIVNADLPYAKKSLLVKDTSVDDAESQSIKPVQLTDKFDWDDSFSFSSGVISFYWSLDKPLEDLNTHNVFLSTNTRVRAEASWQVLREPLGTPRSIPEDDGDEEGDDAAFNFYVHRPSKTDPAAAPPGRDAIMVLVPCRTLLRDEECAALPRAEAMKRYEAQFSPSVVARIRRAVLKRLSAVASLGDLKDHIIHEEYRTPANWADQYNLAAGTPFALSHGFAQLSLTRPGPESTGFPNVLYCGAGTRPGNGVPLVLIGAKQVAEKAMRSLTATG